MRKEYGLQELADILGCSRTAVVKKIKIDVDNPNIKRYRNRYDVVTRDGKQFILLDDSDIENEKRLSKGANNVSNVTQNNYETAENSEITDAFVVRDENRHDKIFEFTERYISEFTTFQQNMYNELLQRDKQLLLLTTSENESKNKVFELASEIKTLKKRNRYMLVAITVSLTLLVVMIISFITFINHV